MPNAILDPTGRAPTTEDAAVLAQPRATLKGARVALLANTKQNASLLLEELGQLLVSQHGVAEAVPCTKNAFAMPVPEDQLEELASGYDVVVTGVGDCGSCSASAVADGVLFEQRGIPAAVICSDAFRVTADAMAQMRGASGYHYVTTPHPVAILNPDEVRKRANEVLPEVVSILTGAG
ncbi:MAG: hypothetical protein GEU98_15180 [Pseudonocardiaceae bacterium]|nr:hypothetical protein [Pseudonocardiaceae bacterium]